MKGKPQRLYPRAEANILGQAEKINGTVPLYKAVLQARYPALFTEAYLGDLNQRIEAARSLPSDLVLQQIQATETAALMALVASFAPLGRELTAAASNAFPGDPAIQALFGVKRLSELQRSPDALMSFLADFNDTFSLHGAALLAANLPAHFPDTFAKLESDLRAQKIRQAAAVDNRHIAAQNRTANINQIWSKLRNIEKYIIIIYGKHSAEAVLFHLDRGSRGNGKPSAGTETKPA